LLPAFRRSLQSPLLAARALGLATHALGCTADYSDSNPLYLRKNLRMPKSAIQYRRVTPSFFAISSEQEGMIYYSRCNLPRGASIHCFDLVYPQREKRAWDFIVTRNSVSLRPLQS
jgi:hypothetical protein